MTVGAVLGFRIDATPPEIMAALLLLAFSLSVSWATVLVGILTDEPEKVMVLGYTVAFPLSIASNRFIPESTMPGWLQQWVRINPITHLADSLRGLLTGGPVRRLDGHHRSLVGRPDGGLRPSVVAGYVTAADRGPGAAPPRSASTWWRTRERAT